LLRKRGEHDRYHYARLGSDASEAVGRRVPTEVVANLAAEAGVRLPDLENASMTSIPRVFSVLEDLIHAWGVGNGSVNRLLYEGNLVRPLNAQRNVSSSSRPQYLHRSA